MGWRFLVESAGLEVEVCEEKEVDMDREVGGRRL